MCSKRGLSMENVGASSLERVRAGAGDRFDVASVTKMLSAVYDEFVYGQVHKSICSEIMQFDNGQSNKSE